MTAYKWPTKFLTTYTVMILACTKPVGVLDHTCTSFKLLVPNQLEIASYGPALWCSYEYFCPPVDYHHLSTRFDFHWKYSSQERPTNILATLPLLPLCTDGGKVVSTLIILTDIARSTPQHGHQVMCIKWNKPLDTYSIHRVRVGLAARSVVYTRIYN